MIGITIFRRKILRLLKIKDYRTSYKISFSQITGNMVFVVNLCDDIILYRPFDLFLLRLKADHLPLQLQLPTEFDMNEA